MQQSLPEQQAESEIRLTENAMAVLKRRYLRKGPDGQPIETVEPVTEPIEMVEPVQPIVKEGKEPGRNDPCPCGSGKKYKKCCALKEATG